MNATNTLPDIQKTIDIREVAINSVGVAGVKLPLGVLTPTGEVVRTVATIKVGVSLPAEVKGTHMSRFSEVLHDFLNFGPGVCAGVLETKDLPQIVHKLREKLGGDITLQVRLDYFAPQPAPATGKPGVAHFTGLLELKSVSYSNGTVQIRVRTGIDIVGKTVCPCSREISGYDPETGTGRGAHAQRGRLIMRVDHLAERTVQFEELLLVAWNAFSSPVYPVLKRPDEKHVTEAAYANPKFCEDVVRDAVLGLRKIQGIHALEAHVQNAESIHYHDAYAHVHEVVAL